MLCWCGGSILSAVQWVILGFSKIKMAYRISHTKLRNLVSKYFLHNHQIKFTLWAGNFYYPRMIYISILFTISVQFSSVTQSCLTLCDPMNCSTPGLPVHHQLPEFTQINVPRVSDAIQPSHPQSSPSPPAPNPSQHQSLFQWINSSHEVAKVLKLQL